MELVQIEVVGLQTPQRCFDRAHDVVAAVACLPRLLAGWEKALAGKDELVASTVHPFADDALGRAHRLEGAGIGVHVGGVEERDASVGRSVHDCDRRRAVGLEAERHRSKAEAGNFEAGSAESHVFHDPRVDPGHARRRPGRIRCCLDGTVSTSARRAGRC